jgi:hypothetical protein
VRRAHAALSTELPELIDPGGLETLSSIPS